LIGVIRPNPLLENPEIRRILSYVRFSIILISIFTFRGSIIYFSIIEIQDIILRTEPISDPCVSLRGKTYLFRTDSELFIGLFLNAINTNINVNLLVVDTFQINKVYKNSSIYCSDKIVGDYSVFYKKLNNINYFQTYKPKRDHNFISHVRPEIVIDIVSNYIDDEVDYYFNIPVKIVSLTPRIFQIDACKSTLESLSPFQCLIMKRKSFFEIISLSFTLMSSIFTFLIIFYDLIKTIKLKITKSVPFSKSLTQYQADEQGNKTQLCYLDAIPIIRSITEDYEVSEQLNGKSIEIVKNDYKNTNDD
jgi:hypothetical protein